MIKNKSFIVGKVNNAISKYLPNIDAEKDIYQSHGLYKHIIKRHPDCKQYINNIPDIINEPDYIGVNPNEKGQSFELVKVYEDNIQIGIKLDLTEDYLYVATLHKITPAKISKRLANGRLKNFDKNE